RGGPGDTEVEVDPTLVCHDERPFALDPLAAPALHHPGILPSVRGDEARPRVADAVIEEPLDEGRVARKGDDQPRVVIVLLILGIAKRRNVHREHPDGMLMEIRQSEVEVFLPAHTDAPCRLTPKISGPRSGSAGSPG